jgi:hypothetical protein
MNDTNLNVIWERIRNKNAKDKLRYLEWRKVKKNFYMGEDAIETHFQAETLVHAKETHKEEMAAEALQIAEDAKRIKDRENFVNELQKLVDAGRTYFDLGEDTRKGVEELHTWLSAQTIHSWQQWHLKTAELLERIPDRQAVLSRIRKTSINDESHPRWEYQTITAKTTGASAGIASAFMNQGLEPEAATKLAELGNEGWEIVSTAPLIYGALASVATSALIVILKRQKLQSN